MEDTETMGEVTRETLPFTICNDSVLYDTELSTVQKVVFWAIASHADNNTGSCFPSYKRIALLAGCARETAMRAVRVLVERGHLRKHVNVNGARNFSNTYTVPRPQPVEGSDSKSPGGDRESLGGGDRESPGGDRESPELYPPDYIHRKNYNQETADSSQETRGSKGKQSPHKQLVELYKSLHTEYHGEEPELDGKPGAIAGRYIKLLRENYQLPEIKERLTLYYREKLECHQGAHRSLEDFYETYEQSTEDNIHRDLYCQNCGRLKVATGQSCAHCHWEGDFAETKPTDPPHRVPEALQPVSADKQAEIDRQLAAYREKAKAGSERREREKREREQRAAERVAV